MKILIVEDEAVTALDLKKTFENFGHAVVALAKNYSEAITAIENLEIDLVIIDIILKNSVADGIEIARFINQNHKTPFIFLTASSESETFIKAKELYPAAYLLKPFNSQEVIFQIELAFQHFKINYSNSHISTSESVFFPTGKGHRKINKSDILYLKADGNFTFIYLNDGSFLGITGNLGYYSQFFSSKSFFHVHRSYLINIKYINYLETNTVYLFHTEEKIPISINRKNDFLKLLAIIKTK